MKKTKTGKKILTMKNIPKFEEFVNEASNAIDHKLYIQNKEIFDELLREAGKLHGLSLNLKKARIHNDMTMSVGYNYISLRWELSKKDMGVFSNALIELNLDVDMGIDKGGNHYLKCGLAYQHIGGGSNGISTWTIWSNDGKIGTRQGS